jgi:pyrimidine deaminase RibD-like protein
MDKFMQAAIEEARAGLAEGGIPIGSVTAHAGPIIGRGHNRRVQQGSAILHAEMDANPRAAARVFPAQAGMNRAGVPSWEGSALVPRAGGDQPISRARCPPGL